MRILTATGFLGVSSKQTRLGGFAGGWGRESWGDGVKYEILPLCIVYIILYHGTLYASHVELTLFHFHTLWGKYLQIDFVCLAPRSPSRVVKFLLRHSV